MFKLCLAASFLLRCGGEGGTSDPASQEASTPVYEEVKDRDGLPISIPETTPVLAESTNPEPQPNEPEHTPSPSNYCPTFSETRNEKLIQWIQNVQSLKTPSLGNYIIGLKPTKGSKVTYYQEQYSMLYSFPIPPSVNSTKGKAQFIELKYNRTGDNEISCIYEPEIKKGCADENYILSFCLKSKDLSSECLSKPTFCEDKREKILSNDVVEANVISLGIHQHSKSCHKMAVELPLEFVERRSPSPVRCGDVMTESTEFSEDLNCDASYTVALTLLGDGLKLSGNDHRVHSSEIPILIMGNKNIVNNFTLKKNPVLAYQHEPNNFCENISFMETASFKLPFYRLLKGLKIFFTSLKQLIFF